MSSSSVSGDSTVLPVQSLLLRCTVLPLKGWVTDPLKLKRGSINRRDGDDDCVAASLMVVLVAGENVDESV